MRLELLSHGKCKYGDRIESAKRRVKGNWASQAPRRKRTVEQDEVKLLCSNEPTQMMSTLAWRRMGLLSEENEKEGLGEEECGIGGRGMRGKLPCWWQIGADLLRKGDP